MHFKLGFAIVFLSLVYTQAQIRVPISSSGHDDSNSDFSDSQSSHRSGTFTNGGRVSGSVNSGNAGRGRRSTTRSTTESFENSGESFHHADTTDSLHGSSGFDNGDSDSSDRIANSNSNRGSGSSRGSSSGRFPDNFRIEIEVLTMENKGGLQSNGKSCDVLSSCDPKLYADIDTENPSAAFPKKAVFGKWPVIFSKDNTNSPVINKVVNRDVCGGASGESVQANLRVHAVDMETFSAEDDLSNFSCVFPVSPQDVGTDPLSTGWSPIIDCQGSSQIGKIKLSARARSYQLSSSECNSKRELSGVSGPAP